MSLKSIKKTVNCIFTYSFQERALNSPPSSITITMDFPRGSSKNSWYSCCAYITCFPLASTGCYKHK